MRVVIVGGGFGGVRSAIKLANKPGFDVKLIASQSYFEYHAALYRSATGRSPLEVAIPLRDFFAFAKNVEVVEDRAAGLSANERTLVGASGSIYPYDTLILALGNVTEFYGIKGLEEYAYGVKTINEALRLKRHLHEQLIAKNTDKHYVVVGAGATGVELAAELTAYIKKLRKKHGISDRFSVDLVEAGPRLLGLMPASFSRRAERRLKHHDVTMYLNTPVKSEDIDSLHLPNGEIRSHTVIWTAGVTNNPFFAKFPDVFKLGKSNRVAVDGYLSAAPGIYVIGDSADTVYSGMAQTALHDANFVAENLLRQARGQASLAYAPKKPIYAIPVGPRWAMVLWGKVQLQGRVGWILRRLADLRLYLNFLPLRKALITWKYGFKYEEICPICKQ